MMGGPSIKHLDDVPTEEMLRWEFADGHTASIWEKWIEMSPRYFAFWNRWEPGALSPLHGHTGDHINLILAGDGAPFSGDPAALNALLEARGARSVALPMPKRLPPWAQTKYAQGSVTNWTADEPT
jgi:hypothetical protein